QRNNPTDQAGRLYSNQYLHGVSTVESASLVAQKVVALEYSVLDKAICPLEMRFDVAKPQLRSGLHERVGIQIQEVGTIPGLDASSRGEPKCRHAEQGIEDLSGDT
ncbi:hypothetical protein BFJ68_g17039, partial [Fusarium oxysporum]